MLNIITGRSGSGKTTYVNSILGELASAGNEKLILIVPEQFSFASERAVLSSLETRDAGRIEVLSFTRLANFVGRQLGGLSGEVPDEGTKIILMLRALEGVCDELKFYSKHIESVALAQNLIHLIGEFKRECITPEMLRAAADKTDLSTLASKLHDLALIYTAYTALFEGKWNDSDSIPDKLVKKLDDNNFFNGYTIAIDAFKGYTAQELEIIKRLISQAENVYLTLPTNDIYNNDPSMIWNAVNETGKRLIRLAKLQGVPVYIHTPENTGDFLKNGRRFKSEALLFLEENIFYPTDKVFTNRTDDIVLCVASSPRDECNYIAATIRKLMRTENIRLKDMAVITRNEDFYKRELIAAFGRYGIPVFEDVRQPIMNQPLISLCKSAFTILTSGFTTENIIHYLKTGLSPLNELEVAELENYALMWNLSARDWKSDFTLNPNGMNAGFSDESTEKLATLNDMRIRVIVPLLTLKKQLSREQGESRTTASEISEAIYDFLISCKIPERLQAVAREFYDDGYQVLAQEQNRIWEILMDTLSKLSSVYGDTATSVKTYYNLFCAVISTTDLGRIPHGLDEIVVGQADRIRLSSPKVVFITGCAEGVFPKITEQHGLLSTNDRKNLLKLGIEFSNSAELIACDERYIAYSALTAPTSKLYATYCTSDGADSSYLPSIIFENIAALFDAKNGNIDVLSTSRLPDDYFAETQESAFSTYANLYSSTRIVGADIETESTISSLRESLSEDTTYSVRLDAFDTLTRKKPFEITNPDIATELFGKSMYLSASRVDSYYKCAFQYFCKYGLKAKPREKAELNPALRGTVIHYVLEHLIREHGKDGLLALNAEERKSAVSNCLTTYLNNEIGGFDDKTLRFRYLYNRLAFSLYDVVDRLCAEFSVSDFVPCDFELPIGNGKNDIPAYTLELNNGGKLELYGNIDRVDKFEKEGKTYIRVVDYKSGGKEFALSDILDGLNMQMLIYLFAVENGGSTRYGNIIPSGIMYYNAKRSGIKLTHKNMDPVAIEKEKSKHYASSGLFLINDDILEAMEHGQEGKFISIVDGHGRKKDNLVTLEEMGRIKKRIDFALREMTESLQSGKISAYPITGGNYKNTCDYCDFASVCRIEDGEKRELKKMKTREALDILLKNEAVEQKNIVNELESETKGGAQNE